MNFFSLFETILLRKDSNVCLINVKWLKVSKQIKDSEDYKKS